jgi:hypothetical protein
MGDIYFGLTFQLLNTCRVLEDHCELAAVMLQLGVGKAKPGKTGNMSNINFDRHESGSLRNR